MAGSDGRRRRTVLVVASGVAGAVALVILIVVLVRSTQPAFDAANAYLRALADGDLSAAAAQRCDSDLGEAENELAALRRIGWTGGFDLTGYESSGDGTAVVGSLGLADGDGSVTAWIGEGAAGPCVIALVTTPSDPGG